MDKFWTYALVMIAAAIVLGGPAIFAPLAVGVLIGVLIGGVLKLMNRPAIHS